MIDEFDIREMRGINGETRGTVTVVEKSNSIQVRAVGSIDLNPSEAKRLARYLHRIANRVILRNM